MKIFGKDYPTKGGICIRYYILVTDIAQGHIIVLKAFEKKNEKFFNESAVIYSMGTNKDYSVKGVLETYEKANEIKLNYTYCKRRDEDATIVLPVLYVFFFICVSLIIAFIMFYFKKLKFR